MCQIRVSFVNEFGVEEAGIDGGGIFKDFMENITRAAFDVQYGLFKVVNCIVGIKYYAILSLSWHAKGKSSIRSSFLSHICAVAVTYVNIATKSNFISAHETFIQKLSKQDL